MNTWTIQRIGSRAAGVMLGAALVFALMLMTARQAGAQELDQELDGTYEECTDASWAEYNRCLVTSKNWWGQIHCDLDWEANMVSCVSAEIEEIRD